jgi:hypothetical protein
MGVAVCGTAYPSPGNLVPEKEPDEEGGDEDKPASRDQEAHPFSVHLPVLPATSRMTASGL